MSGCTGRETYAAVETEDDCRLHVSALAKKCTHPKERLRTTAEVLVTMLDVEVDLVGDARTLSGLDGLGAEEGREGDEQEAQGEPTEDHGGRRKEGV